MSLRASARSTSTHSLAALGFWAAPHALLSVRCLLRRAISLHNPGMKTPDLEQVLLASLIQEWGYVVGSAGLRQTLGFASQSALRVAIANGTVPVRVFRIPGRKGPFVPWEPRELVVPDMQYVPGSGIGTVPATGELQRGSLTAADNALAHQAKLTTTNLTQSVRGVLNLGRAYVPETRAILEAFFRQIENGAIRHLPGGFEPARDRDTPKRATTPHGAERHPLNPQALHDLMDVVIAGFDATQLAALGDQSPMDVVRRHGKTSGWTFVSSQSDKDAGQLTRKRVQVVIKGNKKEGRQPFVNFMRARYRAFGLTDRWDLVGKTFNAFLSVEDLRRLTLLDEHGDVFVVLTALPPWGRTQHDFDLRKLIIRWSNRKLFSIAGVEDAVAAYRDFVRLNAERLPLAADQVARNWPLHAQRGRESDVAPTPSFTPRGGHVSFDHVKDPIK